jgi:hypothetical protein
MVGNCFLANFCGLVRVGVEEFQALHHSLDEATHHLGLLLDGIQTDIDRGIGVGTEFLRDVEERLAP